MSVELMDENIGELSAEDYQECRAYLQRGETRLSTLHRVAGAFLGGAGLLTLLPVLFRDTFSELFSGLVFLEDPLLPETLSWQRLLLLAPVVASLLLPVFALYFLISDLVKFYFTGHNFHGRSTSITYPRFILSGILLPNGSDRAQLEMRVAREEDAVTGLLIPQSDLLQKRMIHEAQTLGKCRELEDDSTAERRRDSLTRFLYEYTASDMRTLHQEAAKMEASLARHHIMLRVLVLRYAKAFLLTILTTGVTILALVALDLVDRSVRESLTGDPGTVLVRTSLVWMLVFGIYAVWCLLAVWVVRRPIVWIYSEFEGKILKTPQSLLLFERYTSLGVLFAALVTLVLTVTYSWRFGRETEFWLSGLISLVCLVAAWNAMVTFVKTWRNR